MSIDGMSLSVLVAELNHRLAGGRIDKIYQVDRYTIIFWIRQPGENVCLLVSANPDNPRIHFIDTAPENPSTPPAFCMLLRKHLADGRITRVGQHSLDRIVEIDIDVREEQGLINTKTLVAELMGKYSNIILKREDDVIDAIKRVGISVSRFRQVFPGSRYLYPPGQDRLNILTIPADSFVETVFQIQTASAAKAMMETAIGLGPVTVREILWRAGLPEKITLDAMDDADRKALSESVASIVDSVQAPVPAVIVDDDNHPKAVAAFLPAYLNHEDYTSHTFHSMNEALAFASKLGGTTSGGIKKNALNKIVSSELSRLDRKESILSKELQEANDADAMRIYGDLLMANLYTIPQGATEASVENLYAAPDNTEAGSVVIDLDPGLTPLENARNYYVKYNKLKRAQKNVHIQLEQCQHEKAYLEGVSVSLEHAASALEIAEIRQELVSSGYIKETVKRHLNRQTPSSPLTLKVAEEVLILVGKNNRQNDFVTLKQARPDDLWFHTQNIPGSHVILKASAANAPFYVETAAQLAAYFSKARQSSGVPVDYTKRRHVRKPSGAKPGFVIYDNQKTIYITPDEQKIKNLLQQTNE